MGLFGSSRKKKLESLFDGLPDSEGHWTIADADPTEVQQEYDPGGQASPGPAPHKGFNWGRAALGFVGGPGVATMFEKKDREAREQAEIEQKQAAIQQAQSQAFQWAKSQNYSDADARALALDPKVVAQMVQANHAPQKFDSGGGSLYQDGKFTIAPSERQVGRDIVRTDSAGTPSTVFSGIEPVPVQGMGVYGWNNKGPVNPPNGSAPATPSRGSAVGMTDEQIAEMERRAAGGATSGSRGFLGARRY